MGILADDTVRDVYGQYLDQARWRSDRGPRKVLQSYAGSLGDADEAPLIGFGQARWDCGELEPEVVRRSARSSFAGRIPWPDLTDVMYLQDQWRRAIRG